MDNKNTKQITYTALMAALVCVATFLIKIPSINGYTHLGDCMIFVSVLILGRKNGALAGGIGAALADFLGGYMLWIIPTFLIKSIMALIMGLIVEKALTKMKFGWLIGAIFGGIFQIIGYTLVKIPLYGIGYAMGTLPVLIMQTISGIAIAFVIMYALLQTKIIRKVKEI